jgi:prepilin-type N-terminal cleavage/methylation domain-containing protein
MKQKGFTLIDLMVTMAVFAILAIVGIPTMRSMIEDNRLRSSSEELYSKLTQSKARAIDNQNDVTVNFVTGQNWCYGANTNTVCSCNVANNCTLGSVTNNANQTSLSITGFTGSNAIIKSGQGTLTNSGKATFSLNGKSVSIIVSQMGLITICSDTVGGYASCL